jgi:hypothetical protein
MEDKNGMRSRNIPTRTMGSMNDSSGVVIWLIAYTIMRRAVATRTFQSHQKLSASGLSPDLV